jgi:hypothetical protein
MTLIKLAIKRKKTPSLPHRKEVHESYFYTVSRELWASSEDGRAVVGATQGQGSLSGHTNVIRSRSLFSILSAAHDHGENIKI